MARKIGTPLTESELIIHIAENCVLKDGKHRYVFIDILSPKIYRLSHEVDGSTKLYVRFSQILYRGLYNTEMFYGLRAINIDLPQKEWLVSVRLKIVIGEGEDEAKESS
jgi:hypothetical protein